MTNLVTAIGFYKSLGFEQIVDSPRYARFQCPDGRSTFSLSLTDKPFSNGAIIYFEHQQLDTWVTELKDKGITFIQEVKDEKYLWREAVLEDPSGNIIKLYWAGENRLNPPWKIKGTPHDT